MKIGDLVEYVDFRGERLPDIRELGTILRDDHGESDNHCYIVWHTTDNEGWWDTRNLKVVSKNENR
jgi:hypothetical protein